MAKSFTVTTGITPVSTVTNKDVAAVFFPFIESESGGYEIDGTKYRVFTDPGDITIPGQSPAQITLEMGGAFERTLNGTRPGGEITYTYRADPNKGPVQPFDPADLGNVTEFTPEGVLFFCKIVSDTAWKVYAELPVNFLVADDMSWPRNSPTQTTAHFQLTGPGKKIGFDVANQTITITGDGEFAAKTSVAPKKTDNFNQFDQTA